MRVVPALPGHSVGGSRFSGSAVIVDFRQVDGLAGEVVCACRGGTRCGRRGRTSGTRRDRQARLRAWACGSRRPRAIERHRQARTGSAWAGPVTRPRSSRSDRRGPCASLPLNDAHSLPDMGTPVLGKRLQDYTAVIPQVNEARGRCSLSHRVWSVAPAVVRRVRAEVDDLTAPPYPTR